MSTADGCNDGPSESSKNSAVAVDIKRRLSAHVQSRMTTNGTGQDAWPGESFPAVYESIKHEPCFQSEIAGDGEQPENSCTLERGKECHHSGPDRGGGRMSRSRSTVNRQQPEVSDHKSGPIGDDRDASVLASSQNQTASSGSGNFMAGSLVLSNSILDEVLNEKKLALLQSPEVIKFLRESQNRT